MAVRAEREPEGWAGMEVVLKAEVDIEVGAADKIQGACTAEVAGMVGGHYMAEGVDMAGKTCKAAAVGNSEKLEKVEWIENAGVVVLAWGAEKAEVVAV
jgi:hypothetical protein